MKQEKIKRYSSWYIRSLIKKYGSWFVRGVLIEAPVIATFAVVGFFISQSDKWLGPYVSYVVRTIVPANYLTGPLENGFIPGFPLVLWVVITILIGRFAMGRYFDMFFLAIPGINIIYGFVRSISGTISEKKSFQRVVWVKWPHESTMTLGLVAREIVDSNTGEKWLACLVSSVPNTTTGYVNLFRESDTYEAEIEDKEGILKPMTVGEAFSLIVSLGTQLPEKMPLTKASEMLNNSKKSDS